MLYLTYVSNSLTPPRYFKLIACELALQVLHYTTT